MNEATVFTVANNCGFDSLQWTHDRADAFYNISASTQPIWMTCGVRLTNGQCALLCMPARKRKLKTNSSINMNWFRYIQAIWKSLMPENTNIRTRALNWCLNLNDTARIYGISFNPAEWRLSSLPMLSTLSLSCLYRSRIFVWKIASDFVRLSACIRITQSGCFVFCTKLSC